LATHSRVYQHARQANPSLSYDKQNQIIGLLQSGVAMLSEAKEGRFAEALKLKELLNKIHALRPNFSSGPRPPGQSTSNVDGGGGGGYSQ
jgi:hypothetical protein